MRKLHVLIQLNEEMNGNGWKFPIFFHTRVPVLSLLDTTVSGPK